MSPRGVLAAELDSLGKSPPLLEWEEISLIIEMERSCSIPFVKSSTLRRFRMEGAASLISSFTIDIEFEDESESESIVECEATELRRETFSCACVCVCVCICVPIECEHSSEYESEHEYIPGTSYSKWNLHVRAYSANSSRSNCLSRNSFGSTSLSIP